MPILPPELVKAVREVRFYSADVHGFGLQIRLIPYENVGGSGVMPAVKADLMTIAKAGERLRIERVYIGISARKIGDDRYSCLLNPDLVSMNTTKQSVKKQA